MCAVIFLCSATNTAINDELLSIINLIERNAILGGVIKRFDRNCILESLNLTDNKDIGIFNPDQYGSEKEYSENIVNQRKEFLIEQTVKTCEPNIFNIFIQQIEFSEDEDVLKQLDCLKWKIKLNKAASKFVPNFNINELIHTNEQCETIFKQVNKICLPRISGFRKKILEICDNEYGSALKDIIDFCYTAIVVKVEETNLNIVNTVNSYFISAIKSFHKIIRECLMNNIISQKRI